MAGSLLRTIWLLYLRDDRTVELMILAAAIRKIYIKLYIDMYIIYKLHIVSKYIRYIYIYIYIYIKLKLYICIFAYFCIGQSLKEVYLAGIKNCLALVVKVKSLKSITSRQCH